MSDERKRLWFIEIRVELFFDPPMPKKMQFSEISRIFYNRFYKNFDEVDFFEYYLIKFERLKGIIVFKEKKNEEEVQFFFKNHLNDDDEFLDDVGSFCEFHITFYDPNDKNSIKEEKWDHYFGYIRKEAGGEIFKNLSKNWKSVYEFCSHKTFDNKDYKSRRIRHLTCDYEFF